MTLIDEDRQHDGAEDAYRRYEDGNADAVDWLTFRAEWAEGMAADAADRRIAERKESPCRF